MKIAEYLLNQAAYYKGKSDMCLEILKALAEQSKEETSVSTPKEESDK